MKRMCAWCKTAIDSPDEIDLPITHGMCPACETFLSSNTPGRTIREFLDTFTAPILLVDKEGRVLMANDQAQKVLNKIPEEIEGRLGGEAIECGYARLPEGCGKTVHCKACAIRNSVNKTNETGESLCRIEAYQDILVSDEIVRMRFLISTEKVDHMVFLRVDEGPVPK